MTTVTNHWSNYETLTPAEKLEYLAVYGRASMAASRQLSTHIVPPRSNVREARLNKHGQKFDRESLYEPIKFDIFVIVYVWMMLWTILILNLIL